MHRKLIAALPLVLWFPFAAPAAEPGGHPKPKTVAIPMRDGARLAADIFLPAGEGRFPTIFIFTPYNRKILAAAVPAAAAKSKLIDREHYAFVIADWRGFYGSKAAARGKRVRGGQVGKDGHDVVEWIARQQWSSGKVGMWGSSALGAAQYRTAVEKPPHLTCIVPVVIRYGENYVQHYHGGVPKEGRTSARDVAGFKGTGCLVRAHPTYDKWWQIIEAFTKSGMEKLDVPVLVVGGWYDVETGSLLDTFGRLRSGAGPRARKHSRLLVGPWDHVNAHAGPRKVGDLDFPEAQGVSERETRLFFDYWLRGEKKNGWAERPVVRYFQMGANKWKEAGSWSPAKGADLALYLHGRGKLGRKPERGRSRADSLRYDPADPSPTVGGNNIYVRIGWSDLVRRATSGPRDQRAKVESRKDVLTYTSEPLKEPLALRGEARARLFVSSDRVDTDFMVRLCDVHPGGRSMLVTDGAHRMRFRDSLRRPELMEPGTVYEVTVTLPVTAHTFRRGHRVRVVISSSNYPRFALNPNNWEHFLTDAKKALVATNKVHRGGQRPSAILLPLAAAGREDPAAAYYRRGKYEVRTKKFPDLVDAERERRVPIKVLYPAARGRFSLVVLCHGGAGNWDAHLYDARHLASHGYVALCVEHVSSNTATVKKLLVASGAPLTRAKMMAALQRITTDPEAVLGRPRDVSFAIDQAILWNRKDADLRGRIDTRRVGVAGHSYGAYTTLVVCGARPILDHLAPKVGKGKGLAGDLGDKRVTFGFAMSPQGPGTTFFGPESFKSLRRPVFCLSGSKDDQKSKAGTVMPAVRRLEGFKRMPQGRARMLWLENADHFSFAYNPKSWLFPSPGRADTERIAKTMLLLNCNWYLKRDRAARKLITPEFAKSLTGKVVTEITWLESAADAEALEKRIAAGFSSRSATGSSAPE